MVRKNILNLRGLMVFWLAGVASGKMPTLVGIRGSRPAFLYNFAKFVEWPPDAFKKTPEAPLIVGVLGDSPL